MTGNFGDILGTISLVGLVHAQLTPQEEELYNASAFNGLIPRARIGIISGLILPKSVRKTNASIFSQLYGGPPIREMVLLPLLAKLYDRAVLEEFQLLLLTATPMRMADYEKHGCRQVGEAKALDDGGFSVAMAFAPFAVADMIHRRSPFARLARKLNVPADEEGAEAISLVRGNLRTPSELEFDVDMDPDHSATRGIHVGTLGALYEIPAFAGLTDDEDEMLGITYIRAKRGHLIIDSSEGDSDLRVLLDGFGRVYVPGIEGERTLATIPPGKPVGDISFRLKQPHMANVEALHHVEYARISAAGLHAVMEANAEFRGALLGWLLDVNIARLLKANQHVQHNPDS